MPKTYKCQCGNSLKSHAQEKWKKRDDHTYQLTLKCCPVITFFYKCNPDTCSNKEKFKYTFYTHTNLKQLKNHVEKYHKHTTQTNDNDFVVHEEFDNEMLDSDASEGKWMLIGDHTYQLKLDCCSVITNYYKCNPRTCKNPKKYKSQFYTDQTIDHFKKHLETHHTSKAKDNTELDDFKI